MAKIDVTEAEFSDLVEEVLRRLARDPAASHLWHWHQRPGCADEPIGRSRRNHLASLLGLLGATALGGGAACSSSSSVKPDGATKDGSADRGSADRGSADAPPCGDDPCAADSGPKPDGKTPKPDAGAPDAPPCGDDPCGCGDDPCACGDDPCP